MKYKKIKRNEQELFDDIQNINQVPVMLEQETSILIEDEKNVIVDLKDVFNTDRNNSKSYVIFGKIKPIFKNEYFGSSNYDYIKNKLFLINTDSNVTNLGYLPYDEFAFIRNDYLHNEFEMFDGDLNSFTGFTSTLHNESTHNIIYKPEYFNWNIYLSYVYDQDENFDIKYTTKNQDVFEFKSGDGVIFETEELASFIKLTSPVKHGVNVGEYLLINDVFFNVNYVGDENYKSEENTLFISKSQIPSGFTEFQNSVVVGKRCLNPKDSNSISKYYVQKHKILTNSDDYTLDKLSFESSIWRDERKILFENISGVNDVLVEKNRPETLFYSFKKPFILADIKDNFNNTPKDIYLTFIFRNGNGFFNYPPKVGFDFNFHEGFVDQHFKGDDSLESTITCTEFIRDDITFYSGNTLTVNSELTGSFIEYNQKELRERIISMAYHKITINKDVFDHLQYDANFLVGASYDNQVGLFYTPFQKIKLREESPYIETSYNENLDNLPENKFYDEIEKMWKWRDLYDHGFIDDENNGTDFPFMNGSHYVKHDSNFYIRNEKQIKSKREELTIFNNLLIKTGRLKNKC